MWKRFNIKHNLCSKRNNMDDCVWMTGTALHILSFYTVFVFSVTTYNLCLSKVIHSFSSALCETHRQRESRIFLCGCVCVCGCKPTGAHVLPSNYSARELKPLQCPFNSVNYHNHVFLSSLTFFLPPTLPSLSSSCSLSFPLFLYWCFCSSEVITVCTHTCTHKCMHTPLSHTMPIIDLTCWNLSMVLKWVVELHWGFNSFLWAAWWLKSHKSYLHTVETCLQ